MKRSARRRERVTEISVRAAREMEKPLERLLRARLQSTPVVFVDLKHSQVTVSVYCREAPTALKGVQARLEADLERLESQGQLHGVARVIVRRLASSDWAEAWKRGFHPVKISKVLIIKGSWHRLRPRKGQSVIVMDPGLSFGTGQHPTTAYCLRRIVHDRPRGTPRSFLDLGSGSGVLAIAAAVLGYRPVCGLENDPRALAISRENARRNGVGKVVRFREADLLQGRRIPRRRFDLVCANLYASLLEHQAAVLAGCVQPQGNLVLAGILERQFPRVKRACEKAGLVLVRSRRDGEWRSGLFRWKRQIFRTE